MPQFDLILRNCLVLQADFSILKNATLCIDKGRIVKIETDTKQAANLQAETTLDGSGKLAMPGLIDCHTHSAQQLLRGGITDEMPMVWARILVPFESNLTPEEVYAGAMLFCIENLKAGITTFAESGGPFMEATAQAAIETGIRANIARSTIDQGDFPATMKDTTAAALSKTETLYKNYHNAGEGRVRIWFSVRSAITCSHELVEAISIRSKELNTGVHIHLAEHLDEVAFCLSKYGKRPAEWFDSLNLLGPNLIGAHSVRLSDPEVKLMSERRANAIHCPRSNLSGHGFSKTPLLLALKVNVALGTDGASGTRLDLFEQMRLLRSAMQARYGIEINDPFTLPFLELLKMVTSAGARAVMLQDEIGALEVGKKADIILLGLDKPHLSPSVNLLKSIVMAAGPNDVQDVIVDGKLLMHDRVLLHLDEEQIRRQAATAMQQAGKRAGLSLDSMYPGGC
jgi:5-methylthioadenosine/S-adenosylhomocysteine deaminase